MATSIRAGFLAGIQTYRQQALVPMGDGPDEWNEYAARAFRYLHANHYYWNTAYSAIARYAQHQKAELGLYQHIRPVYNPVFRLVEGYVANVWGGNLDYEHMTGGAIPLTGLDTALEEAIRQVWLWSNWGQVKNRAVRMGSLLGDLPVKVVPYLDSGKVRIEPLDPAIIFDAMFDAVGNVKAVTIAYERVDADKRPYIYQERITEEMFATFRDDQPWAYPENQVNGQPVPEWPNPYGFVPMVIIRHRDIGKQWGGNAYAGLLPKINELNDQASKLHDYVRVALNPVYYGAGVMGPDELEFIEADQGDDDGDGLNEKKGLAVSVLYGPEGSSLTPLVSSLDLGPAMQNLDRMLAEVERDLPELSLPTIRQQGQMTAPGVAAGFTDAISRYVEARGQYDDGIVRLNQMAISIGAFHGFQGFEPFSLESFRAGNLEHYVAERPVIEDSLTLLERVQALQDTGAPAWLIWKLCGLSDEEINKAWAEKQAQERTLAAEFASTVISGALAGNQAVTDGSA